MVFGLGGQYHQLTGNLLEDRRLLEDWGHSRAGTCLVHPLDQVPGTGGLDHPLGLLQGLVEAALEIKSRKRPSQMLQYAVQYLRPAVVHIRGLNAAELI